MFGHGDIVMDVVSGVEVVVREGGGEGILKKSFVIGTEVGIKN